MKEENEDEFEVSAESKDVIKERLAARAAGPFANVLRSKGWMWLATRSMNMGWSNNVI